MTVRKLLFALAVIAPLVLLGRWVGRSLSIDQRLATLGLFLLTSGALSMILQVRRRRLSDAMARLPPEQREALRSQHPELRFNDRSIAGVGSTSVRKATWIGLLWINGPIIPLMILPIAVRQFLVGQRDDLIAAILLLLGFALAWTWWSVNVTLWRRWAARHGVDADELQWRGQQAGLLWRKGHALERTELEHISKRKRGNDV